MGGSKTKSSYYQKHRKEILERMRQKYHEDPEYREKTKKRAKARYHEDPEYRKRTLQRAKERYHKMKKQQNK